MWWPAHPRSSTKPVFCHQTFQSQTLVSLYPDPKGTQQALGRVFSRFVQEQTRWSYQCLNKPEPMPSQEVRPRPHRGTQDGCTRFLPDLG